MLIRSNLHLRNIDNFHRKTSAQNIENRMGPGATKMQEWKHLHDNIGVKNAGMEKSEVCEHIAQYTPPTRLYSTV